MGYTNIRATMKLWYPHTKRLKYCLSEKFDEHNNKFVKGWSPDSILMLGTNISTLPTLKIYLSDHPFIKYDIFEGIVHITTSGTTIGINTQYYEHHNMSYIYQSGKTAHRIMYFQIEIGQTIGSSALSEKNQHQYSKF